jgi:N-acetyl-anhydromuramyl-L-alanine amidase AmpD
MEAIKALLREYGYEIENEEKTEHSDGKTENLFQRFNLQGLL